MTAPHAIRRAQPAELAALNDLILRSKLSNGYDDTFMAACVDVLRITPPMLEQAEYWVLTVGNTPAAIAKLIVKPQLYGEIDTFFVDPRFHRRGLGVALWQFMVARAAAHNLFTLGLDADPAAVAFYAAQGLDIVGTAPSGAIPGRMLPRMEITLGRLETPPGQ